MSKVKILEKLKEKQVLEFKEKIKYILNNKPSSNDIVTLGSTEESLECYSLEELTNYGLADINVFIEKDDELIGFATSGLCEGDEELDGIGVDYILNCVYVFEEFRGMGFGKKLIYAIEKKLKGKKVFLVPTHFDLIPFYSNLGYEFDEDQYGLLKTIKAH